MRLHYPGVFLASLLRAQPMGFYSPASLTADARRHGVVVRRPDINRSGADAGMEAIEGAGARRRATPASAPSSRRSSRGSTATAPARRRPAPARRRARGAARARGRHRASARSSRSGSSPSGPRTATTADQRDLARRIGLTAPQLEALATAGAFEGFGLTVREALWAAGAAAEERPETLPHTSIVVQPPLLPETTRDGPGRRRPVGDGDLPRRPPRRARARRAREARGALLRRAAGRGVGAAGRDRRGRHPPAAAGDRLRASRSSTSRTRPGW